MLSKNELKYFLDYKVEQYNQPNFIEEDPVQIPHIFFKKEDQEIAAFFASIFSWGNRKTIVNKSIQLMNLFDNAPFDFILNHKDKELKGLLSFKHRTFNSSDLIFFIKSLQNIYKNLGGLEKQFFIEKEESDTCFCIERFRSIFLETTHEKRSEKHIANPMTGSTAKRLNMFLRWMVRKDKNGVDLGIWNQIPTSKLSCPLDVHSGNVARSLGLLKRKQNDQKAVRELDKSLRKLDPKDPVKYDFALFGLGVYEDF